jgi:DNA-binding CsgD family transcriptional regulator
MELPTTAPTAGKVSPLRKTLVKLVPSTARFEMNYDELIGAVYSGAMESPPWKSLLELLREQLPAKNAVLVLRPPSAGNSGAMVHCGDNNLVAKESYEAHFFSLDPFVRLDEGTVATAEEVMGRDAWLSSAIYREYLSTIDVRHILGADVYTREGIECRLRITRGQNDPEFSDDDKAVIRLMLPHLKRAIQLHARIDTLECDRQVFAGTVNRLSLGMICFAQTGEIIEMNQEAKRILAERDGIRLSGNSLYADSTQERRDLNRLIQQAIAGAMQGEESGIVEAMPITRPSGRSRLGLLIRAIPAGPWSESRLRPAAAVFIRDAEATAPQPSQELVRRLFGLTRVESTLALLLVEGLTLDEASERMNIRRNTARTHLRAIFCKTGVTRQTMLVKLLLNSVVSLG